MNSPALYTIQKMKKRNKDFKILMAILIVLTALLAIFISSSGFFCRSEINGLRSELDSARLSAIEQIKTNHDLTTKKQLLEKNIEELTHNNSRLTAELGDVSQEKDEISTKYDSEIIDLDRKLDEIRHRFDDYKAEIHRSLAWFEINSNIITLQDHENNRISDQFDRVSDKLYDRCLNCRLEGCRILTRCIPEINHLYYMDYKDDEITSNSLDELQGLDTLIFNKGGDCEDLALLYAAELRYLFDRSKTDKHHYFIDGLFDAYDYSDEEREGFYFLRTDLENLHKSDSNVAVVCGALPFEEYDCRVDLGNGMYITTLGPAACDNIVKVPYGHCVVAISDNEISSSDDIPTFLENAILIEAQDGTYFPKEDIEILSDDYPDSDFYIYLIITEDDLYHYSLNNDEYQWIGYRDFLEQLNEFSAELSK